MQTRAQEKSRNAVGGFFRPYCPINTRLFEFSVHLAGTLPARYETERDFPYSHWTPLFSPFARDRETSNPERLQKDMCRSSWNRDPAFGARPFGVGGCSSR